MIRLMLALLLVFPQFAFAQGPIALMVEKVGDSVNLIDIMNRHSGGRADAVRQDAIEKLDRHLTDSIAAAEGKPDVLQAVKAYYLAAKTFIEFDAVNGIAGRSQAARLKADVGSAKSALELEAKLAGI